MGRLLLPSVTLCILVLVGVFAWSAQGLIDAKHKQLDLAALNQVLAPSDYDNDLLSDAVRLSPKLSNSEFVKLELLGLRKDRLAYIAKQNNEVAYVIVPATADDGFNGYVDLLVVLDMYGRVKSVRVIRTDESDSLYGTLNIIPSRWLTLFADKTFRDIQRLSWTKISASNEYDLFVGASVTPKTVSAKVYDALIFFQSNRVAFIQRANGNGI